MSRCCCWVSSLYDSMCQVARKTLQGHLYGFSCNLAHNIIESQQKQPTIKNHLEQPWPPPRNPLYCVGEFCTGNPTHLFKKKKKSTNVVLLNAVSKCLFWETFLTFLMMRSLWVWNRFPHPELMLSRSSSKIWPSADNSGKQIKWKRKKNERQIGFFLPSAILRLLKQ